KRISLSHPTARRDEEIIQEVSTYRKKIGYTLTQKQTFAPVSVTREVKCAEMHHKALGEALAWASGCAKGVHRGHGAGDSTGDPPMEPAVSTAQVTVPDHPGQVLHMHLCCTVTPAGLLRGRRRLMSGKEGPKLLKSGDAAVVAMVPCKPTCAESVSDYPPLGIRRVNGN
ncbi:putative elongation factor 1-alpha-like 3, partial [Galemys pyrenaicus]